jgi:hypothetical protein
MTPVRSGVTATAVRRTLSPGAVLSALAYHDLPPSRADLERVLSRTDDHPGLAQEIDARWGDRLRDHLVCPRYALAACALGRGHPPMIARCLTELERTQAAGETDHQQFVRTKHLTEAVLRHGNQEQVKTAFASWASQMDGADTMTVISWHRTVVNDLIRVSSSATDTTTWPTILGRIVTEIGPTDGPLSGAQLGFSLLQFDLGHDDPLGNTWARTMATGTMPLRRGDPHPLPIPLTATERAEGLLAWCERQVVRDRRHLAEPAILGAITSLAVAGCLPGTTPLPDKQEHACRMLGLLARDAGR